MQCLRKQVERRSVDNIKPVVSHGPPCPRGFPRGCLVTAYYWNQHEKTKATLFGEWIQTGDKYYQDKGSYFWYCGQADDMLKVGGIWVSPVEVENTLVGPALDRVRSRASQDGHRQDPALQAALGISGSGLPIKRVQSFLQRKPAHLDLLETVGT